MNVSVANEKRYYKLNLNVYGHLIEFSELSLIVNRELTSRPIPPVDNISLMSVQTASSYSKYGMDHKGFSWPF